MTSAYHPQANGMVERLHRQLKASLKTRIGPAGSWVAELPLVLLSLRATPKADIGYSPADMVFGLVPRLPGQMVCQPTRSQPTLDLEIRTLGNTMRKIRSVPPAFHGNTVSYIPKSLATAKFVFLRTDATRSPLENPYSGPHRVIAPGSKTFLLEIKGKTKIVSIDRLKPAFNESNDLGGVV